jgi:hypothetical protein
MGGAVISIPRGLNLVSSSSTRTEVHEWRITNYSLLQIPVGTWIASEPFALGGHNWQFLLYPGGYEDSCADYVALFINKCDPGPASPKSLLRIMGSKGNRLRTKAFTDDSPSLGGTKVILRKTLLDPAAGYIKDDIITVQFIMVVATAPNVGHSKYQSLQRCFSSMLNDDSNTKDVIFRFANSNAVVCAHRCVLCSVSPVFRAMFQSEMAESQSGEVLLTDIRPAVMKELLIYMYTAAFSTPDVLDSDIAKELLLAASKYDVIGVIQECEESLATSLTVKNLHELKQLADACNCTALKKRCVEFAVKHCPEILMNLSFPQQQADSSAVELGLATST